MLIDVVDERTTAIEEPLLKDEYPVGSIVFVKHRRARAVVVDHESDAVIVVMYKSRRTSVNVRDNEVVLLARSAEAYAERVRTETYNTASRHNVSRDRFEPTLIALLTSEPSTQHEGVLRVKVTNVSYFVVKPQTVNENIPVELLMSRLRSAYFAQSGEFDRYNFRHVNLSDEDNDRCHPNANVQIELVDNFVEPSPDESTNPFD